MKHAYNKTKIKRKGIIFTLEALLSLFLIFSIFSITQHIERKQSKFYEFVFISDVFETLEKGYHDDLVNWVDNGITSATLNEVFNFIESNTGKRVYLSYRTRKLPNIDCETDITMNRMVMSNKNWSRVRITLCK